MGGKSEQTSKPSREAQIASGLLLQYVAPGIAETGLPEFFQQGVGGGGMPSSSAPMRYNPSSLNPNIPGINPSPSPGQPGLPGTGGPSPYTPGNIPGTILPSFQSLQNQAGQSFFGSIDKDSQWQTAMDQILNPKSINVPQIGGGGMGGAGAGARTGASISEGQIQQAMNKLLNPASVFDTMSGGPIVNEINTRTNALQDANSTRAMRDLERSLDLATAGFAADGVISGDVVLRERGRITDDILEDLNNINAGVGLESTKFLGELAMQDVQNQTNSAYQALIAAMDEKGILSNENIQMAQIAADKAIAQARLQLEGRLGQQDNALNLLGLGAKDYQDMLKNQLGTASLPFELLQSIMGLPSIGRESSKGAL